MLNKSEAAERLMVELDHRRATSEPVIIVENRTIEKAYGWVFFYESKKYMDTKIFRHRLAGNGPAIVNKLTGAIEFCGTSHPVQKSIEDYERRLAGKAAQ